MYGKLVSVSVKEAMTYRFHLFTGIFSSFIQLVVTWYIWNAIFSSSSSATIGGFTLQAMITYVVMSTALRPFQYSEIEFSIESHVKTGFISNLIVKPWNYFMYNFSLELGNFIFHILTRTIPILIIGIAAIGISLPSNVIMFIISALLGYLISYTLSFMTGMWAFWSSGGIWGMRFARQVVSNLLSGIIIPISLFPLWLSSIASYLPFQAIFYIPLSIYTGTISGTDVLVSLGIQTFWLIALLITSLAIWKTAERKIFVHGG
jgi:ABC-2 type transport system permease protein